MVLLAIAAAFVPDEALALGEVIGTIPVDPLLQGRTVTAAPGRCTGSSPGVSQVQIAVEVGFVDVDQPDRFLDKLCAKMVWNSWMKAARFSGLALLEHLLAFLPTQTVPFEELAQRRATRFTPEDLLDPASDLLHTPVVSGQVMLDRLALFHGGDDLLQPGLG